MTIDPEEFVKGWDRALRDPTSNVLSVVKTWRKKCPPTREFELPEEMVCGIWVVPGIERIYYSIKPRKGKWVPYQLIGLPPPLVDFIRTLPPVG